MNSYRTLLLIFFTLFFSQLFSRDFISGKSDNEPNLQSVFNPETAEWNIAWPERLSQYDLVYLSPPIDPMQGIPLGNGDIGVLFWCEDSRIIAVVNKSDLWDDAESEEFRNWKREEEDYSTTLRHACRIIIDLKFPVFNTLYLSDFRGRLNLADASISLEVKSPFGSAALEAFVDHSSGILFMNLSTDMNEDVPVDICLERYGSRTFSHWYSSVNRDASIGLPGTDALAGSEGAFITHKLTSGTFAVGGRVIHPDQGSVRYYREHSHRAVIQLDNNVKKNTTLAFLVTSPLNHDPVAEIKNTFSAMNDETAGSLRQSHLETWKNIWNRSFMDYGDDYLNNLWYLTMYYANASQGGKYPGRFNNGLWTWNRDVQQWNFYFHWNQQQLYWPLNAAGFHRLALPYLDFRFNSLPYARKDAKEVFNARGAFISDVTERRGINSSGENENHTPVAEIALDFWRQYRFTCDRKFLEEKALPFILEAARFYESLLEKEEDGLYHAREGTGYEGWIKMKNGLTELVYAKALFSTALEALKTAGIDLPESLKWKEILENLAPLPVVPAVDSAIITEGTDYTFNRGLFKGKPAPANEILAAGWSIKEKEWLTVYYPDEDVTVHNGLKLLDGIFPSVPSSPVFPSGVVGLGQQGSKLFDQVTATTLLYSTEITGWDPVPVVMARLGLAEELAADLERFPARWQIYCNGWGHWGLEGEVNKDAEWFFRTNTVGDVAGDEKFPLPMWPFRHMSMESMSILATAMNESLLQSHEGVIRIFPAFPAAKTGRFTLHARGGFVISSEIRSGEVQWICVKSLCGNTCRIELPWDKAFILDGQKKKKQMIRGEIAEIETQPDDVIMIIPEGKDSRRWEVIKEKPAINESPRYHSSGKAQLGLTRMY